MSTRMLPISQQSTCFVSAHLPFAAPSAQHVSIKEILVHTGPLH